jgi:zinc D-Ala-D-Ala carboxypeptidase
MKLSKNLWLSEVTKSNTATRKGIDNSPTDLHIANLKYLAEKIFQPIREHFGCPIFVSSGYRSKALNEAIGGSQRSFHSHGMALDLDMDNKASKISNTDIFNFIKDNLEYTELIWEFGDEDKPDWVHVAIAKGRENEKNAKVAYREDGKAKYMKFEDWVWG